MLRIWIVLFLFVFFCFFNCMFGGIVFCGRNVKIVMYVEDVCM